MVRKSGYTKSAYDDTFSWLWGDAWTSSLDDDPIPDVLAAVYILVHNETGKYYIGSSIDVRARLYQHSLDLHLNRHINHKLQACFEIDRSFNLFLCINGDWQSRSDVKQLIRTEELKRIAENKHNPDLLNIASVEPSPLKGKPWQGTSESLQQRSDSFRATASTPEGMVARARATYYISRHLKIDGVFYPSMKEAARRLRIGINQIRKRCHSKDYPNYEWVCYEGDYHPPFP